MARALSGRCYCGAVHVSAPDQPESVAACHCVDCRRWTGAPLAAFAAFRDGAVSFTPPLGAPRSRTDTVTRWVCDSCGTPLLATFSYLPDQVYVPLGLFDQGPDLKPTLAAHAEHAMPWMHLSSDIQKIDGSARDRLNPDPGHAEKPHE